MGLGRLRNLAVALLLGPLFMLLNSSCSVNGAIKKLSKKAGPELVEFVDLNPDVMEGTTSLALRVKNPLSKKQKLKYSLLDADSNVAASGENAIDAGQTTFVIPWLPLPANNSLDEPNRLYRVVVLDENKESSEILLTVVDDDDPPSLSVSDASGVEGAALTFTASLSAPSGNAITFKVAAVGGTATIGTDLSALAVTSLTIPAGETSATITVNSLNDVLDEADETFQIVISAPTLATIGDNTGAGTITDDDAAPILQFQVASQNVTEAVGGASVTVTAVLAAASGQVVTVPFTVGGTASGSNVDHDLAAGTMTIAAGATTGTYVLNVVDDLSSEPTETIVLTLGTPTNATLSGQAVHTINIIDNDGPPTISISNATAVEGTSLIFTVSMSSASGQVVSFDWSTNDGTATTADTDYSNSSASGVTIAAGQSSVTLTVPTGNDSLDELDETMSVTLANLQNAVAGSLTGNGTIQDNDPAPSVQFTAATQTTAGAESGSLNVVLQMSAVSGKSVVVPITVDGSSTAAAPADFSLSASSVTIAPGATSATITFVVASDLLNETDETVVLNIGTPSNAGIGSVATQSITINDDDAVPALSIADLSVAEGGGPATLTISLSAVSGRNVTFDWTTVASGTATSATDFTATSGNSLTIPAGSSSLTVNVPLNNDTLDEADETFAVTISNQGNATIGDASALVTITDDDATPSLSVADVTIAEGAGNAVFTVSLSAASGRAVTFDWSTSNGSAIA